MAKLIENVNLSNADGKDKILTEKGHDVLEIKNSTLKVIDSNPTSGSGVAALDVRACGLVKLTNVVIEGVNIIRKYAYGVRSGYSNTPADENKYLEYDRVTIKNFGAPVPAYDKVNHDCNAFEGGERIRLKDCVFDGATDACMDGKIKVIEAKRCHFKNSYRLIRHWESCQSTFVECTFDTPFQHFWHYDNKCKTRLFKCEFKQPIKTDFENSAGIIEILTTDPLTDDWFKPTPKKLNLTKEQLEYLAEL